MTRRLLGILGAVIATGAIATLAGCHVAANALAQPNGTTPPLSANDVSWLFSAAKNRR